MEGQDAHRQAGAAVRRWSATRSARRAEGGAGARAAFGRRASAGHVAGAAALLPTGRVGAHLTLLLTGIHQGLGEAILLA